MKSALHNMWSVTCVVLRTQWLTALGSAGFWAVAIIAAEAGNPVIAASLGVSAGLTLSVLLDAITDETDARKDIE